MKLMTRNLFVLWIFVTLLLTIGAEGSAQTPSAPPAQSASEDSNSAAAKAAARKKRFEEIKRRMELGEEGAEGLDADEGGGAIMRIVSMTPHVNTDASNRRTTESLRVVYELEAELPEGHIEIISAENVTAEYPLPSLKAGRHAMTIPGGMPLTNNPYTFTCNLEVASHSGITLMVDSLWDNRDRDSSNTAFPQAEDDSVYDYKPGPAPEEAHDPPADEAAAFRGDEMAISSFVIPAKRNRARRSVGKLMEIQVLGVGFSEGTAITCSKQIGGSPGTEARTSVHDVRVVSTASHDMNESIPVLRAGRFDVPEKIAAHGTYLRIIGKVK
jgi:hypothetical protein